MAAATLGITTTFVIGTTAVQVCATNTLRRGLRLENTSTTIPINYGFGTGNAATTSMHVLTTALNTVGVSFINFGPIQPEFTGRVSLAPGVPAGDLSVISTVTNGVAVVTEW